MRAWLTAGLVGGLFNLIAGSSTAGPPSWLYLAGAIISSGLVQVILNHRERKRTGEGESSAAESVARGAQAVADAGESLVAPLERQVTQLIARVGNLEKANERLVAENQELHRELADATREAAQLVAEALRARELADDRIHELERQLATTLALAGRLERRAGERRAGD